MLISRFKILFFYLTFYIERYASNKHLFKSSGNDSHHHNQHIFLRKKRMVRKSAAVNKNNFIDILKNGSLYNFEYYNCTKFPESKNVSQPNNQNSLLLIKTEFFRNHNKKKEVSFNVTTQGNK